MPEGLPPIHPSDGSQRWRFRGPIEDDLGTGVGISLKVDSAN